MSATYDAMAEYRTVGVSSRVMEADPHQLITMLMQGVLDAVAKAGGALETGDVAVRGEELSRAIAMLETLRACLDHTAGAQVSTNLDTLYQYMSLRLLMANVESRREWLDEVASLMREVKSGWDEIPEEARAMRKSDPQEAITGRAGGSNMVLGSC